MNTGFLTGLFLSGICLLAGCRKTEDCETATLLEDSEFEYLEQDPMSPFFNQPVLHVTLTSILHMRSAGCDPRPGLQTCQGGRAELTNLLSRKIRVQLALGDWYPVVNMDPLQTQSFDDIAGYCWDNRLHQVAWTYP